MKVYQVIMQDEWNNLNHLGFYKDLKDSLNDINEWLEVYDVHIDEIEEYPSTFSMCFDREVETDEFTAVYIRGFIFDSEYLKESLKELGD